MTPELRWLSDPTVFAVNRLDAHSDHLCCRTLDEAESGLTSLRQSLDGAWRFAWSANPAARPADFWQQQVQPGDSVQLLRSGRPAPLVQRQVMVHARLHGEKSHPTRRKNTAKPPRQRLDP